MRRRNRWNDKHDKLLTTLLAGGATFGAIDHAWNRELFMFTYHDLLLGLVITTGIFLLAGIIMLVNPATLLAPSPCKE